MWNCLKLESSMMNVEQIFSHSTQVILWFLTSFHVFRLSPCQPPVVAPTPLVSTVTVGAFVALLLEILRLLQDLLSGMTITFTVQPQMSIICVR